jgi:AcrR family transcriptional regulator
MRRAAAVAKTRTRIVAAARRQLARAPVRDFALEAVAQLAGVTRVTIYNQFGNKAGLVEALFRDTGDRMGLEAIIAAVSRPDPRDALGALARATAAAWARERPVLQRLVALAAIDPDARRVLAYFEGRRLHDAEVVVARLHAAGQLVDHVTRAEAAAAITAMTSFQVFDQLAERVVAPGPAIERMVAAYLA